MNKVYNAIDCDWYYDIVLNLRCEYVAVVVKLSAWCLYIYIKEQDVV